MSARISPMSKLMVPALSDLDKSQIFMKKKLSIYVDRLLARQPNLDSWVLGVFHLLIGPEMLENVVEQIAALLTPEQRQRFKEGVWEDICEPQGFSSTVRMLVRGIRRDLEKKVISIFLKTLNKKLSAI